jgi:hypothetical protein
VGPGLLAISLAIGGYQAPKLANAMLVIAVVSYAWLFLTWKPIERRIGKQRKWVRIKQAG